MTDFTLHTTEIAPEASIMFTNPLAYLIALTALVSLAATTAFARPSQAPAQDDSLEVEALYGSTLWKKSKYDIEGSYRIESRKGDGGREVTLVLGSDFATKEGPDLKVVLSPIALDKVKAKTALKGGLVLGVLESNRGGSRYRIPADTDLAKFRSVLIHCKKYSVLWGGAPLSVGEVVASGSEWQKKTRSIEGRWEIAKVGKGHMLRLGSDFATKKAPDLKAVLSPLKLGQARNENALAGGLVVSVLRSHKGAQEFAIPEGTDLSTYRSLLIHCKKYTKLWGGAKLDGS